jgi:hypothetical protein
MQMRQVVVTRKQSDIDRLCACLMQRSAPIALNSVAVSAALQHQIPNNSTVSHSTGKSRCARSESNTVRECSLAEMPMTFVNEARAGAPNKQYSLDAVELAFPRRQVQWRALILRTETKAGERTHRQRNGKQPSCNRQDRLQRRISAQKWQEHSKRKQLAQQRNRNAKDTKCSRCCARAGRSAPA